jgi:hypothetical protein
LILYRDYLSYIAEVINQPLKICGVWVRGGQIYDKYVHGFMNISRTSFEIKKMKTQQEIA